MKLVSHRRIEPMMIANRPSLRRTFRRSQVAVLLPLLLMSAVVAAVEPDHRAVEYAQVGTKSLLLDVYLPKSTRQTNSNTGDQLNRSNAAPLVIWIHGGAWRSGSRDNVPVTRWLQHGAAIASVDYRLSPEAPFPAQIHDIKAAIRFLRHHATEYGLDADQFVIAGASAGGHLAALTGVSNGVAELEGSVGQHLNTSSDVQAIVSFYGASNLQSILSQSTAHGLSVRVPALQLLLEGQPQDKPALARLASPVAHVDPKDPPLWLIHGDADPQMPFEQSRELEAVYQKVGLPVRLDIVVGGKHGGEGFFTDTQLDQLAQQVRGQLE
ncbi:MAG: alpha/beta hydrolase [Planctomycetaceae bacterium]|nr:alpha/beta hydrolase [Planctomycetaceae bacterium]